jgi:hypothetical protein
MKRVPNQQPCNLEHSSNRISFQQQLRIRAPQNHLRILANHQQNHPQKHNGEAHRTHVQHSKYMQNIQNLPRITQNPSCFRINSEWQKRTQNTRQSLQINSETTPDSTPTSHNLSKTLAKRSQELRTYGNIQNSLRIYIRTIQNRCKIAQHTCNHTQNQLRRVQNTFKSNSESTRNTCVLPLN